MPKWIKFIIAILLLPVCAGAGMALSQSAASSAAARDTTWIPFLAGAACWLVIFYLLPKPMWIYVFGHELTHALWTWLFGGQVKKMKVTAKGGHVVISKTNFVIALAPYFLPLYVVLVVGVFALGNLIWNWNDYLVWFHMCVGADYAFHLTLTFHVHQTQQSDITGQGYLFSAVVIFLGNAYACCCLGFRCWTARVGLLNSLDWWLESTGLILHWLQTRDLRRSKICEQFSLELSGHFASMLVSNMDLADIFGTRADCPRTESRQPLGGD